MPILDDVLNFLGHNIFDRTFSVVFLSVVAYLLYRWILEPVYSVLKGAYIFWRASKSPATFLEITPPSQSEKSLLATQQLLTVLQHTIGRGQTASLEIISSRTDGVRYLIRISPREVAALKRHVASYMPDAQFRKLDGEPQTFTDGFTIIGQPKQCRHYAYPLAQNEELDQSDVVAYVAGSMTKLKPGETTALQMVLTPHHSYWPTRIYNKILNKGYAQIDGKIRSFLISRWWVWLAVLLIGGFTNDAKMALSWGFVFLIGSFFIKYDEPELTTHEEELYQSILNKLGQPLFRTDIRIAVAAETPQRVNQLYNGIGDSLAPLNSPFQLLGESKPLLNDLSYKFRRFKLERRLPSLFNPNSSIFAASELASIYHFPFGKITTEDMVKSSSRTLPAPLTIKNGEFDVILGYNQHHGEENYIGLTTEERARHMFVIGATGCGKTTLLQYAILQDIKAGRGVAVIDPHGDMAEMLLEHIPEERLNDVVYFNPDDLDYPIGLNLLELPSGLSENDTLRARDLLAEAIVSLFRKTFSTEGEGGHRIEDVLRNAVHTAFTVEDATLFTALKLLRNVEFRKQVIAQLQDEDLKDFWREELGKAGEMQRVKMSAGVTTKISRFQRSAAAKRVLEQPKSTINFEDIMNSDKILICNFSKGDLGEDTSELFGIATLTMIQLTTYCRSKIRPAERKPFYLYVDEFQNFATPSFAEMLAEARKYKLSLTMAEQTTAQQEDKDVLGQILGNAGNIICFRTGNPDDEKVLLPQFQSRIENGEIASLPAYNFYMRISAQKVHEPFSGITLLPEDEGSVETAKRAKAASRKNYAKKYVAPELKPEIKQTQSEQPKTAYRRRANVARKPRNTGRV
ncbi:MAG: DUF87 domain-containing protein [Candidatus Woesebacteria bacterium]|jgi:hypothetical protein